MTGTIPEEHESPAESVAHRRFDSSVARITFALAAVGVVAFVWWFSPDWIARQQAYSAYGAVEDLIGQRTGPKSPGQVYNAIKIEPTTSGELIGDILRQTYVFEGRTKDYTVIAHYMDRMLVKVELESERSLR